MSSRSSLLMHFLPVGVRCRDNHVQYNTRINARFHAGQNRRNINQNTLSESENRAYGPATLFGEFIQETRHRPSPSTGDNA